MSTEILDRFASASAVADAVLYEGYVLYPYRASSPKNQMRWQFGVLTPRAFSDADGSERWSMRTECLVDPGPTAVLSVRMRCLQVQHRAVERLTGAAASVGDRDEFTPLDRFEVDGQVYVDWDEAVDQVVDLPPLRLSSLDAAAHEEAFQFAGGAETEVIRADGGSVAGRIVRRREPVDGRVWVEATGADPSSRLVKVAVTVVNATEWAAGGTDRAGSAGPGRHDVMGRSLVAVHTMLAVDGGAFVSLLDPPAHARRAVASCHNDGAFPVLIGGDDLVLSSPIILYDHPEVAPESPGDLYDATEIDEILALRVLTLTDEEKSEARGTDPRAAAIIDRCDGFSPELWERLHGAVRSLGPVAAPEPDAWEEPREVPWWDPAADASVDPWSDSVTIAGIEVAKGSAVRLRPTRRSDAQDLFFNGLTATVAGVFKDVDGNVQVAVTIDDDPATEELAWQGRYLFFHPDEVGPLASEDGTR